MMTSATCDTLTITEAGTCLSRDYQFPPLKNSRARVHICFSAVVASSVAVIALGWFRVLVTGGRSLVSGGSSADQQPPPSDVSRSGHSTYGSYFGREP